MKLIDSHCHLDFEQFSADRDQVLAMAREKQVAEFIVPAVQHSRWDGLIDLCQRESGLHYALGLHPMFISQHKAQHIEDLSDYLNKYQPCAIGEIGLDFFDRTLMLDEQMRFFEAQLKLACEFELPVILHVRKAHEEVLGCLKRYPVSAGIVHAFNGSLQQAERYQKYGFKFGFGGMLTYARSTHLRKLARDLPLASIVLETDSPDMVVEQHRGERNSPVNLPYCLQALAEIRQLPIEQVAAITTNNTVAVLQLRNKE